MLARILVAAMFLAGTAQADALDERLLALSERIEKAEDYASTGGGLQLDELTKLALELEAVLTEMRQVERQFDSEKSAIETKFYEESEELMQLIGFVTTFSSQPAPDFILHPQGASASVEANIIIASMMERLEQNLGEVATDLQKWREVSAKEDVLTKSAQFAFNDLNRLREGIVRVQDDNQPISETEEPMVLDALFAVSTNLNDFVKGLDQISMGNIPETQFSMADAKGTLQWPVNGDAKPYRNGVQIFTDDSFVIAPATGTVRFEANFLDYGQTIIIEPEKDYLIVLAGMARSAVVEGDLVKQGEVIGFMATEETENQENASEALRMPQKSLYVETRYKTAPIPTTEYFRAREN